MSVTRVSMHPMNVIPVTLPRTWRLTPGSVCPHLRSGYIYIRIWPLDFPFTKWLITCKSFSPSPISSYDGCIILILVGIVT